MIETPRRGGRGRVSAPLDLNAPTTRDLAWAAYHVERSGLPSGGRIIDSAESAERGNWSRSGSRAGRHETDEILVEQVLDVQGESMPVGQARPGELALGDLGASRSRNPPEPAARATALAEGGRRRTAGTSQR